MRIVFAGACKKVSTGLFAAQIHYISQSPTPISSFSLRRRHKMTSFTCLNSINMQSTLMSKMTSRKAFSGALVPSTSRAMRVRHQIRTVVPQALFTKNKTKNEVCNASMHDCASRPQSSVAELYPRHRCRLAACQLVIMHACVFAAEEVPDRQERKGGRSNCTRLHTET